MSTTDEDVTPSCGCVFCDMNLPPRMALVHEDGHRNIVLCFASAASQAAPAPGGQEGWQPIETAPKDGVSILLWAETWEMTIGIQIGSWSDFSHSWHGEAWDAGNWDSDEQPTHWLSLPPLPDDDVAASPTPVRSPAPADAAVEALRKCQWALSSAIDLFGPDPAGMMLTALNATDKALSAQPAGNEAQGQGEAAVKVPVAAPGGEGWRAKDDALEALRPLIQKMKWRRGFGLTLGDFQRARTVLFSRASPSASRPAPDVVEALRTELGRYREALKAISAFKPNRDDPDDDPYQQIAVFAKHRAYEALDIQKATSNG